MDTVVDQGLGIFGADLVLRRAGKGTVGLVTPKGVDLRGEIKGGVSRLGIFLGIFLDPPPPDIFEQLDVSQSF